MPSCGSGCGNRWPSTWRESKSSWCRPTDRCNGLPWAALPGSHPGTFLVHEYAFAVVPVPQLLPELLHGKPRLANQQPSLLLAGGIDFGEANDP